MTTETDMKSSLTMYVGEEPVYLHVVQWWVKHKAARREHVFFSFQTSDIKNNEEKIRICRNIKLSKVTSEIDFLQKNDEEKLP